MGARIISRTSALRPPAGRSPGRAAACASGACSFPRRTERLRTPAAGSSRGRASDRALAAMVSSSSSANRKRLASPRRRVGSPHLDRDLLGREAEGSQAARRRARARPSTTSARAARVGATVADGRLLVRSRRAARRRGIGSSPSPRAAAAKPGREGGVRPAASELRLVGLGHLAEGREPGLFEVGDDVAREIARETTGAAGPRTTPRSPGGPGAGRGAGPRSEATRAASLEEARPSEASRPRRRWIWSLMLSAAATGPGPDSPSGVRSR